MTETITLPLDTDGPAPSFDIWRLETTHDDGHVTTSFHADREHAERLWFDRIDTRINYYTFGRDDQDRMLCLHREIVHVPRGR